VLRYRLERELLTGPVGYTCAGLACGEDNIPCLGFAIGELFDFAALAAACRRESRYEFLFTSVPLNVAGAVGSPANAVAIL